MKTVYRTGAHTKHRLLFHIVFLPKYRKRILRFDLVKRLRQLIWDGCQMNDWIIHQLKVQPDHVHLLLQLNPADSLSHALQMLKGGTSRVLRQEFPELEEFLWGDSFWSDGYFSETVGRATETTIRRYLENQRNKQE